MWLGLFERVHVYVGTGVVLVQRSGMPVHKLEPAPTLPLADVLRWVDERLQRASAKPWWLSVHMSAALCAPMALTPPPGLKRKEMFALAEAAAAQAWGLPASQADAVVCRLASSPHGLAASFLSGSYTTICEWAALHRGRLVELVPLWAAATQASCVRSRDIDAVAVLEPEALTWIRIDDSGTAQASCWYGRYSVTDAQALLFDSGGNGAAKHLTGLTFATEANADAWKAGPRPWRLHWSPWV